MASLYWDSDQEQMINKKKVSIKNNKEFDKLNHLPPEAFTQDFDPPMADVWSFGVLLCQLFTKEDPFKVKEGIN